VSGASFGGLYSSTCWWCGEPVTLGLAECEECKYRREVDEEYRLEQKMDERRFLRHELRMSETIGERED